MLVALAFLSASPVFSAPRPPSGIPELDSLPEHDWGVPNRPLSLPVALGLSAAIPGGGQFYGGHPVRGSFLLGLESLLLGLSLYSHFVDLPARDRDIRRYADSADAAARRLAEDPSGGWEDDVALWTRQARRSAALRLQYADLANSQLAWAVGLHFYGMADAVEIVRRSRDPDPPDRSVGRALLYGVAFPGGGQLYNARYGKFGMLWMTLGAATVSAWSRQNVVESLNGSIAVARAEERGGLATNLDELEQDRTTYRRLRNQYYWGMALFYVYAIMDGMVDAALSDFDSPRRYAFGPGKEPLSFMATLSF